MSLPERRPSALSHLTVGDAALSVFQLGLTSIPVVGGAIDKLVFGNLSELRLKRLEQTLQEVGERLEKQGTKCFVENNEDFANLLESVIPALGRATNEEKRRRFRDLLLKAAQTPAGEPRWDEATLAARLLDEIDPPGLAILAALADHLDEPYTIDLRPKPTFGLYQIPPGLENQVSNPAAILVAKFEYDRAVIEEWVHRLQEMRVIQVPAINNDIYWALRFTGLGRLLIEWTIDDDPDPVAR